MSEPYSTLLAFDCSGASCSAAVLREGEIAAERFEAMARGQAEALLPMIEAVMLSARLSFADLDAVVTTTGPGSFTGLRIGIAAARGLALASNKPLIGITAFDAIFHALSPAWSNNAALSSLAPPPLREAVGGGSSHRIRRAAALATGFSLLPTSRKEEEISAPVAVVIDSRRGPVFAQLYTADGRLAREPASVEPAQFLDWLPSGPVSLAGDGVPSLAFLRGHKSITMPATADVIHARTLAFEGARRPRNAAIPLQPLYLRAPDVTLPKPSQ